MATENDPYAAYAEPVIREPRPSIRERESAAELEQKGASAAKSGAETVTEEQTRPAKVRKGEAEATQAEIEVEEATARQRAAVEAARKKAATTQEDVNLVLRKLSEARKKVSGWSTGWGSYLRALPETQARTLYGILGPEGTVSSRILLQTMEKMRANSASGATGLGAMDRSENATLKNSITSLDLGRSPQEVLASINDLERYFRRYAAVTQGYDPDQRDAAIKFGLIPPEDKATSEGKPPPVGGVTSAENVERPAQLRGLNTTVAAMLREGRSASEIKQYLNSVEEGLGDRTTNIDWWATEMKKPEEDRKYDPEDYVNIEEVRTQASAPEKAIGDFATSPLGTALLGATDFATMGLIPQLTSDPEATRAAIKGAELERPGAFLTGQVVGGVTGGLGLESLAARYGLKLSPAALSAIQSGGYGYGTSEEQGLAAVPDALSSAALGYAGGKGGELLGRGVGYVASGSKNAAARMLRERGVPLTLGEIVGPRLRGVEERLANLPIIGPTISARLEEGTAGFNRAAFDEALANLGDKYRNFGNTTGQTAVRKARKNVSQAFEDALSGVQLTQDDVFQRNVSNTWTELGQIPDVGPKVLRAVNDQLGEILKPGRPLTGTEVQAALRKLGSVERSFKNNELYASSIAPRLRGVEDEIRGLVERQAPDILPAYDAANGAWRKVSVLNDAVKSALKNEGADRGLFSPIQLQSAGISNAEKFTGKGSSVTRGYPFAELAEAGQDVLTPRGRSGFPFTLPLTTAGLVGGTSYLTQPGQTTNPVTGAVTGEERDLAASAALGLGLGSLVAAPYSRLGQRALTSVLMGERGANMQKIGDLLTKYGPGAGAGVGAAYLGGAPSRGTPDVGGGSTLEADFVPLPPMAAEEALPEDMSGLTAMPSADTLTSLLPEGAVFDPSTNEIVMPDGRRLSLNDLATAP